MLAIFKNRLTPPAHRYNVTLFCGVNLMNNTEWSQFINLCDAASQENCLDELLRFFFTLEEQEQMGKRIILVKALLAQEKSQREIAKDLKISISKITRGSTMLKQATGPMKQFLTENLLTDKQELR